MKTETENMVSMETRAPRRKRRGLGIVELGLYLIIVAALVGAVIVAFYQLQTGSKQGQVTSMVNDSYAAVQDLHRTASSYGADGTDLVDLMEVAEMIPPMGRIDPDGVAASGDESIMTPFGEPMTIAAGGAVGAAGQSFTITLQNYTRANCVDFMSSYVGRSIEQTGMLGASSNGAAFAFPLTVAGVSGTCANGALALEFR